MRTLTKRILSMALAFCLCLTLLPNMIMKADAVDSISLMVSYAQERVGKTGQELGYNDQWCAFFVSDCAVYAGQTKAIPYNGSAHYLYFAVIKAGGKEVSTPQKGDLVFYNCSACDTNNDGIALMHVGLVENANYSIEGNLGSSGSTLYTRKVVRKGLNESYSHGSGHNTGNYVKRIYVRPAYDGGTTEEHTVDTSYGTNFTAYPKAKITAENIFDAYHNQRDTTSWIGTSDKCTIHEVYTDGCCKVTYPLDAGGTKTVYSKISLFNTHTHSYTGNRVYESAHPHRISQRCVDYATCGGYIWTDEYYEVKTCEQCWHATFSIGASSISVNVGESKTVSVSVSGCWPDSAVAYRELSPDNDVVEVTIKNQQATFTGLKAGATNFSMTVYSDSSKSHVIGTITIPVTVTEKVCTHSYSYKVTKEPTTSAAGTLTGTCSKCSGTTTVTLPKLNTTDYTYSVVKAATCEANGTGRYTWKTTTYGTYTFDVANPKTGHSYSYKVTKEPTVSATGTLTGTCSKCSGTTTVTLPKLNTTDYTYSVIKESSYTEAGTGRYTWKTTTYGTFHFDVTLDKLAAELTRIEIASNPTKTVYQIGETLDTTGLRLKATYSDGSAKTITGGFTTSGFDSSSAGEKTVTVSFNGKTAAFTVTVEKNQEVDPNAPQFTVGSKSAISGQTITVEITAANMPSVKSLMLENFRYDSQILEFVGAELNLKGALIADWDSKDMIATVAFAENTDINGVIMTLTFRVKADAEGECPIACDVYANQLQTGGSETQVKLTVVPGTVTVMTYARGDVNGDGYVNSDDAIYLLRCTLSPSRYPINQSGDMNGDGYVNSDDAIYLLRHTLSPVRYPLN